MGNIIYIRLYLLHSKLPLVCNIAHFLQMIKVCRISCRLQELSGAVPCESSGRAVRFCGVIRLVIRQ